MKFTEAADSQSQKQQLEDSQVFEVDDSQDNTTSNAAQQPLIRDGVYTPAELRSLLDADTQLQCPEEMSSSDNEDAEELAKLQPLKKTEYQQEKVSLAEKKRPLATPSRKRSMKTSRRQSRRPRRGRH